MTRKEVLQTAEKMVCGHREQDYGSPEDNFKIIADFWSTYKGVEFSSTDVAIMMALLKVARIKSGSGTDDSFVDLAGYAACAAEVSHKTLTLTHEDLYNHLENAIAAIRTRRFDDFELKVINKKLLVDNSRYISLLTILDVMEIDSSIMGSYPAGDYYWERKDLAYIPDPYRTDLQYLSLKVGDVKKYEKESK